MAKAAVIDFGTFSGLSGAEQARAIHMHSDRRHRPFVKVHCGSIPAELLESELFGYERGLFTGVIAQRIGRFESANGGTVCWTRSARYPCTCKPSCCGFFRGI
jgi:transcriptional regulator of acetoin/glycerol metabolism